MASIGSRIREARKSAKIAQGELARMIHTSQSYVCDIEHDRVNPSISTLKAIAKVLNVDVAEFISEGGIIKETGLANDEMYIVKIYRNLNETDKELAKAMLQRFLVPVKSAKSSTYPITSVLKKNNLIGLVSGRV